MRKLVFVVALGACGGTISTSTDGGDTGDDRTGSDSTAGYTDCTAPSGNRVCYGPKQCGENGCMLCIAEGQQQSVAVCLDQGLDPASPYGGCRECSDGYICALSAFNATQPLAGTFGGVCVAQDFAPLFVTAGEKNRLFYADRSRYTGAALPTPSTCPDIPGLPLCGGPCMASCPMGTKCVGRSPNHPFSLCIDHNGAGDPRQACSRSKPGCPIGKCLIFKVPDADQPVADAHGICEEMNVCMAAAQSYPGGAYCL